VTDASVVTKAPDRSLGRLATRLAWREGIAKSPQ
jgi:hypothetical protein